MPTNVLVVGVLWLYICTYVARRVCHRPGPVLEGCMYVCMNTTTSF